MLVSLTFKGFFNKNIQICTQSFILMTKKMTFYFKIQMSVTPDKNFISALDEGLTCETLQNIKVAAFLNEKCRS